MAFEDLVFVSVIIPARHSQRTIHRTIDTLIAQTRPPDEILVVIEPDDETRMAIEDQIASGLVRVVEVDRPAHIVRDAHWKRRIGAQAARGTVLFFIDSKIILERQAIACALRLMHEHLVEVVAGVSPAWPEQADHFLAKVQDRGLVQSRKMFPEAMMLKKDNFGKTESLPITTALMMTRRAFECIQDDFGVKFSIEASSYEDYVVAWLLVKCGINILVTNQVVAYHKHRLVWKDYMTEVSRSGQGAALMLHRYPDCPLGRRRLLQALAVFGGSLAGLFVVGLALLLFGWRAAGWLLGLVLGGYVILGIANAIKARDVCGVFIPPFTMLVIYMFFFHFVKWCLKRECKHHQDFEPYFQIH